MESDGGSFEEQVNLRSVNATHLKGQTPKPKPDIASPNPRPSTGDMTSPEPQRYAKSVPCGLFLASFGLLLYLLLVAR